MQHSLYSMVCNNVKFTIFAFNLVRMSSEDFVILTKRSQLFWEELYAMPFRPSSKPSVIFTKISLFNEDFIFLEAERWGPRAVYNKKEARAYNTKLGIQGELTPGYLLNANTINEKIGIKELIHPTLSQKEEGDQLYENVNAWMAEIFSVPVKTRVDESSSTTVKLSYNVDGGRYSALQVGFGLTYCLSIVVALLRAKRNDLVIVENPEAHLYPSAQAKITELFCLAARNRVQVMLETHSDHVINGALIAIRYGDNPILLQNHSNFIRDSLRNS